MSDFFYTQIHEIRHAELVAQAREAALARQLPHTPGRVARLWSRLTRPHTRPGSQSPTRHVVRPA